MFEKLFSRTEVAQRLGISQASLYDWLAQSNAGTLMIRGQPASIDDLQNGHLGRERIRIEIKELEQLKDRMRVRPHPAFLGSTGSTPIRASESLSIGVTA